MKLTKEQIIAAIMTLGIGAITKWVFRQPTPFMEISILYFIIFGLLTRK